MACALAETGAARPSLQPFCMKNTQRRVWKATPANPLVFFLDGYPASPQNEIHARTGGAQGNPRLGECKWDWVPRASSLSPTTTHAPGFFLSAALSSNLLRAKARFPFHFTAPHPAIPPSRCIERITDLEACVPKTFLLDLFLILFLFKYSFDMHALLNKQHLPARKKLYKNPHFRDFSLIWNFCYLCYGLSG